MINIQIQSIQETSKEKKKRKRRARFKTCSIFASTKIILFIINSRKNQS